MNRELDQLTNKLTDVIHDLLSSDKLGDILDEIRDAGYEIGNLTLEMVVKPGRREKIPVPVTPSDYWLEQLYKLKDNRE